MQRSSSSRHLLGLVVAPVVQVFPIQINPVTVKKDGWKGCFLGFQMAEICCNSGMLQLRFIPKWSGEAPSPAPASATRATSSASRRCSWSIYHNSMRWPRSVISHKRLHSVAHLVQVSTRTSLRILFPCVSPFFCFFPAEFIQFSLRCSPPVVADAESAPLSVPVPHPLMCGKHRRRPRGSLGSISVYTPIS